MSKKQKRNVNTIGKDNYGFDYLKEKKIYCYLCGINNKEMKKQDLKDNEKMNTYSEWEQYICEKYDSYPIEKLKEFSRYLNQQIRNLKPNQNYLNIVAPILITLVVTEAFNFLMNLAVIQPEKQIELSGLSMISYFLIFLIITLAVIISFTVLMVKVVNPIWENHTEEKMFEDYKEIIDSLIKGKC